eukprot:1177306-Ditylum_brightwellii.AAC.1
MDKVVHLKLQGRMAKLLVLTAPQNYKQYISIDKKGNKVLYVKLQKALYGCLRSALLFYRNCHRTLSMVVLKSTPMIHVWPTKSKYCKLRTTRGKVHDYLGMQLDYSKEEEVEVDMKEYIVQTIEDCPEEIGDGVTSPAADHLF